ISSPYVAPGGYRQVSAQSSTREPCPLWVITGHLLCKRVCPAFPPKADTGSRQVVQQSRRQRIQQGLGLFKIARAETFGEPTKYRDEKITGLIPLALIAPKSRHAHCCTQLPGFCLLPTRDCKRVIEIRFRFRCISLPGQQYNFAGDSIDFDFAPLFLGSFDRRDRFANRAPGVLKIPKLGISARQV